MSDNFLKQWDEAAKASREEDKLLATFCTKNPKVPLFRIHDSILFESEQDRQLFLDFLALEASQNAQRL